MKIGYSYSEIYKEMECLKHTFDKVRVVEPLSMRECVFESDTGEVHYEPYGCHKVWEKEERCKDCISLKALKYKSRYTKFEFINEEVYYVVSKYIEIENQGYVLEIVTKIDNKVEIWGEGYNEFVDRIHQFHKELYKDELTGSYNRFYMKEILPLLIEQIRYEKTDLGVAIIDIDYLKTVNDTHGHPLGDELIVKVAEVLQNVTYTDNYDFVTRYGGDEFILVSNVTEKLKFKKILENVLEKVREISLDKAPKVKVSVSIGAAMESEFEKGTMDLIIKRADERLYEAKRLGRDQSVIK